MKPLTKDKGGKWCEWTLYREEDIKSAVDGETKEIERGLKILFDFWGEKETEKNKVWKAAINECSKLFQEKREESFPTLYGKDECEHNNPLGMCHACSVEREICECKEGVE